MIVALLASKTAWRLGHGRDREVNASRSDRRAGEDERAAAPPSLRKRGVVLAHASIQKATHRCRMQRRVVVIASRE
jgi:hypothetical protein